MSSTRVRQLVAAATMTAAAVVAMSTTAWAHVEASGEPQDGGVTKVTFSFSHGCGEAATTSLRVQLPVGTTDVQPENPTGWTSTVEGTNLSWTGGSIPHDGKGEFVATMKLTGAEGSTVYLPTIQGCVGGLEDTWIDQTTDPEASNAAPRIVIGQATADEGDHRDGAATGTTVAGADDGHGHDETATATAAGTEAEHSSRTGLIIAVVVGVLLITAIVAAFVQRRRESSRS